jgi:hypothetical protein
LYKSNFIYEKGAVFPLKQEMRRNGMSDENTPPTGHVPLEQIIGLSDEEMRILSQINGISHGRAIEEGDCFEVSRFGRDALNIGPAHWEIFRGKGIQKNGWKYIRDE